MRLVLPSQVGFGDILADLRLKLKESGRFFQGGRVLLDQGQRSLLVEEVEALRALLGEYGMELAGQEEVDPAPAPVTEPAVTVREPVRSGQCLKADGNVIILGDVHAGAEILAGRDVIVMGAARGAIAAGLRSGYDAQVFAFVLRPALLRLGDLVARSPGGGEAWRPEVARVRNGQIIVEPFTGWQRDRARRLRKR